MVFEGKSKWTAKMKMVVGEYIERFFGTLVSIRDVEKDMRKKSKEELRELLTAPSKLNKMVMQEWEDADFQVPKGFEYKEDKNKTRRTK